VTGGNCFAVTGVFGVPAVGNLSMSVSDYPSFKLLLVVYQWQGGARYIVCKLPVDLGEVRSRSPANASIQFVL
jgi:hypothetical protein